MLITAGVITKELLTGIVMELSNDVLQSIKKYSVNESTIIHELILRTDIYTQINIVNALASDIEKKYECISGTALEITLISVHEIITKIKDNLIELEKALEKYNNEWITFYKNHEYVLIHDNLEKAINILNKRINMLISCMSMNIYN